MSRVEVGASAMIVGRGVAGRLAVALGVVAASVGATGAGAATILHSFERRPEHPLAPLVADGAGNLYGTTYEGGALNFGTVFTIKTDGSGFALLHAFSGGGADGSYPYAGLVTDGAGNLYGTTLGGGPSNLGTVFTIQTDGSGFALLHSFAGGAADGRNPSGGLVADGEGNLYGTTQGGGNSDLGTIFTIKADGSGFAVLHSFAGGSVDGTSPYAGLLVGGAGNLYGTTLDGGASNMGTIFTITTSGSGFTVLHSFGGGAADGSDPTAGLLADGGGNLYGTTYQGGASDLGTVFTIKTNGTGFALLHSFAGLPADGSWPFAGLVTDSAGNLYGTTYDGGASRLGTVFTIKIDGSSFALLHSFADGDENGSYPRAGLITDGAGNSYGTTSEGGAANLGTVFTIKTDGSGFAVLHSFAGGDENGSYPRAGLVTDGAGNLYGTTYEGGASGLGTIFTTTADGSGFAVLHSFGGGAKDGSNPIAGLVTDGAGGLYGVTYRGAWNAGAIFTTRTDGSGFALLHSFSEVAGDGSYPVASLVADGAGNLYGTTEQGGASVYGTVFTIKTDGSGFALLHSFTWGDGAYPDAGLVTDGAGNLYGTTFWGGASDLGTVFTIKSDGSGFALLHSFVGAVADGSNPAAGLLADGAGNLFGTTYAGGASNRGTIFTIKTDGSGFSLLHAFAGGAADGSDPSAGLLAGGAGNLYGTTEGGGASGLGTVFTIRTDGSGFALLHAFAGFPSDGGSCVGSLVRRGKALYGTTRFGGAQGGGTVFALVNPLWKGSDTPGIYRDSDRQWYLKNTNAPGTSDLEFPYGDPSDLAVVGDWDGDGIDTVGIYRGNTFYLRNSNTAGNADLVVEFGAPGDVPIAGDWDGDGLDTIGVYRPGDAAWFLKNSNAGGAPDLSFTYGLTDETPVVGDWNADGIDTVGIFRASDRQWYLHNTNASGDAELVFPYGDPATDVPIVGDWDNDGTDTVGVYRPAQGEWFLKNTNAAGNADLNFTYGILNEKPVVGDWDGN
ncbi:MAG: hypothetical protein HY825_04470 [Acidobacteria bacterium]|nr:hypothetical protein [Acidobacteriota bacterium]